MEKVTERRRFFKQFGGALLSLSVTFVSTAGSRHTNESNDLNVQLLLPPNLDSNKIAALAIRYKLITLNDINQARADFNLDTRGLTEVNKVKIRNQIDDDFVTGKLLIVGDWHLSKTEVLMCCINHLNIDGSWLV